VTTVRLSRQAPSRPCLQPRGRSGCHAGFQGIRCGRRQDLDAILARPEMRYLPRAVRDGWGPATNPYTRRTSKDRYPSIMALYGVLEKIVRGFQA
jgi:hypothetical protein